MMCAVITLLEYRMNWCHKLDPWSRGTFSLAFTASFCSLGFATGAGGMFHAVPKFKAYEKLVVGSVDRWVLRTEDLRGRNWYKSKDGYLVVLPVQTTAFLPFPPLDISVLSSPGQGLDIETTSSISPNSRELLQNVERWAAGISRLCPSVDSNPGARRCSALISSAPLILFRYRRSSSHYLNG